MTDELSARSVHERHMRESLEYRREYERTRFANDVAVRVVSYRAEHGLSQTALAKLLGMHQSAIARLEAGEHEPSLTTLSRLSQVLGEDFSVDITPDRLALRSAVGLSQADPGPGSRPSDRLEPAPRDVAEVPRNCVRRFRGDAVPFCSLMGWGSSLRQFSGRSRRGAIPGTPARAGQPGVRVAQ